MKRLWLYNIRKKENLTQEEVAVKSEISRAYYTEIENGMKRPGAEVAQRIADVLGFNWTKFFEKKSAESKQKSGVA